MALEGMENLSAKDFHVNTSSRCFYDQCRVHVHVGGITTAIGITITRVPSPIPPVETCTLTGGDRRFRPILAKYIP